MGEMIQPLQRTVPLSASIDKRQVPRRIVFQTTGVEEQLFECNSNFLRKANSNEAACRYSVAFAN
jgi:hypothetical protein